MMKAICTTTARELEVRELPIPGAPAPEHLIIKMDACGINPGDITFLKRVMPRKVATSLYDVWGVSGAGTVIAAGVGAASKYIGKKVAVYRSLVTTDHTIGTWCETAQMHSSSCVILPDTADTIDYCASLVNVITPFAFWKQAQQEKHRGILVTAGSSATGIAMLGIALAYDIPIVSIVRNTAAKAELMSLGAKNILMQSEPDFERTLATALEENNITAVFDGVGGSLVERIIPHVVRGTTIYCYGYLGGETPVLLPTSTLMVKNMTIKSFSNFGSPTVQDRTLLADALDEISKIIFMDHFKTKKGESFAFDDIAQATKSLGILHGKPILMPR
jgi:NADPH:quinone reductase-like Zn-dependent oxidoreductase